MTNGQLTTSFAQYVVAGWGHDLFYRTQFHLLMLRGWTIEGRSHHQRSTSSSRRFVLFCNVGFFSFRVRAISLCGLFFHQVFFSQLHDNTRTKKNKRISLWGEGWLDVFPSSPLSRGSLAPVFSSCSDASCSDGLPGCYDTPVFNWPCIGLIRLHSGQLRSNPGISHALNSASVSHAILSRVGKVGKHPKRPVWTIHIQDFTFANVWSHSSHTFSLLAKNQTRFGYQSCPIV